jgi:hypothetical protein
MRSAEMRRIARSRRWPDVVIHVPAHLGQVVSLMVRFLIPGTSCLPLRRATFGPQRFPAAALGSVFVLVALTSAGCTEKPSAPSSAVTDAAASLAREQAIREAMILQRKKLDGERVFHEFRARIIAGDLKPPVAAEKNTSTIVRALPSWGVRRVWRLWGRRPREMPWFDEGAGANMLSVTRKAYKLRDDVLNRQIEAQGRKIEEAKKYLDLVTSLEHET